MSGPTIAPFDVPNRRTIAQGHPPDWQPARPKDLYEATGCLHRVSKNPAAKGHTRVLAVVLHPRDARQITIPEPKK
jgi:hypothetical protein